MGMQDNMVHYEAMCRLTGQMAEAARGNDWDLLGSLEREVATIREYLRAEDASDMAMDLSEAERERKRELILRMLADDREIRRHTEPWMASVRALLAGSAAERSVRKAYGSSH
ncbi:flagellar protein FliT [Uliginosibacterium sp. H3]|uniref:Flagellar protein FliT n=1 Tax=Uliginosibacterium silvisoli TaxID=3114758 RepID=A0ABU6K8J8_9RHOO|nr:flagellar protein FliT [Uliginosibacterium sp. H3]